MISNFKTIRRNCPKFNSLGLNSLSFLQWHFHTGQTKSITHRYRIFTGFGTLRFEIICQTINLRNHITFLNFSEWKKKIMCIYCANMRTTNYRKFRFYSENITNTHALFKNDLLTKHKNNIYKFLASEWHEILSLNKMLKWMFWILIKDLKITKLSNYDDNTSLLIGKLKVQKRLV